MSLVMPLDLRIVLTQVITSCQRAGLAEPVDGGTRTLRVPVLKADSEAQAREWDRDGVAEFTDVAADQFVAEGRVHHYAITDKGRLVCVSWPAGGAS